MFTRIVVGDDGSAEGRDAVVLGEAIATATGAGLTLLQTYSPALIPILGVMDNQMMSDQAARQLLADVHRFAPDALTEVVADSTPARALTRHAQSWHADLLVIGSSRRAEIRRAAVGTTGRGLIEKAPCAIAIAKRGLHEQGLKLSSVAVGYDGGEEAEVALHFADEIAAGAGANLVIHSVTPEQATTSSTGNAPEVPAAAAASAGANSQAQLVAGDPGGHLRTLSDSADLMVIGSRRWGAIARIVLGGVGETLASDCGASLLITCRGLPHPPPVSHHVPVR